MGLKKLFIPLLFAVLLISLACGQDFNAFSDYSEINICKGDVFIQNINVQSEFSTETVFTIYQDNSMIGGNIVPTSFILGPGDSITVSHIIPSQSMDTGEYESEIIIQAAGVKKSIVQDVNVEKCQNINVETNDYSFSNCPCTTTVYSFNLTNTGNFPDAFNLGVDTKNPYYSLSQNPVFLAPGASQRVFLFIKLPCDMVGTYQFDFLTESRASGLRTKTPFYLHIRPGCYNFTVGFGEANLTSVNVTPT